MVIASKATIVTAHHWTRVLQNFSNISHMLLPSNVFIPPQYLLATFLVICWLNLITHRLLCPITQKLGAPIPLVCSVTGLSVSASVNWRILGSKSLHKVVNVERTTLLSLSLKYIHNKFGHYSNLGSMEESFDLSKFQCLPPLFGCNQYAGYVYLMGLYLSFQVFLFI